MKIEKYKFDKSEIKEMMDVFKKNTPEEALKAWAYTQYPLRWSCVYYIKRVGKTFIEIGEMY